MSDGAEVVVVVAVVEEKVMVVCVQVVIIQVIRFLCGAGGERGVYVCMCICMCVCVCVCRGERVSEQEIGSGE